MQNKEYIIAKYLAYKILNKPLTKEQMFGFLSWFEEYSLDLYNLSWDEIVKKSNTNIPKSIPKYKEAQDTIKAIKKYISSKKIPEIFIHEFDKKFNKIAEMFNISQALPQQVLQLLTYCTIYPIINKLMANMTNRHYYNGLCNNPNLYSSICNCSKAKFEEQLSTSSPLHNLGLVDTSAKGDIEVSGIISRLMTSKAGNIDYMKKIALGSPAKTKLAPENFEHIADDFIYVEKLLKKAVKQNKKGINILIFGETGTGKTELSKTLCAKLSYDLYPLDREINAKVGDKSFRIPELIRAQKLLLNDKNSVILMDEAEDVFNLNPFSDKTASKLYMNKVLENNARPVIWISNNIRCMDEAYLRRFQYSFELKKPEENCRKDIWEKICKKYKLKLGTEKIEELSQRYDIAPAIIESAVSGVKLSGCPSALEKTLDNFQLATTGKRASPRKEVHNKFNSTLLNTDENLELLAEQLSKTGQKAFSLCLYGAPGTGKSAYARYLADKLKIKVIQKRASDLMGRYVGETEQNIALAFQDAKTKSALLVFDEADSLLRSRGLAHHSFEISAVNEMLTQMESADTPFVCTTNLMSSLDEASLRRFTFKIKYEYMTPEQVEIAFRHFFEETATKSLSNLTHLSPGDFVVVKNKATILGVKDHTQLVKMLTNEMEAKGHRSIKIGFQM